MPKKRSSRPARKPGPQSGPASEKVLRIIGGHFRGRALTYHGDRRTRPMKDRVREATFNLLGPVAQDALAIDLFAGTGALGLEALSRGARSALFLERHFPTAAVIRQNIRELQLEDRTEVIVADTFLWPRRFDRWEDLAGAPWIVFSSPPYDFYVDRRQEMLALLCELKSRAPRDSVFCVEADARFDFELLAELGTPKIRPYPPAVVGVFR